MFGVWGSEFGAWEASGSRLLLAPAFRGPSLRSRPWCKHQGALRMRGREEDMITNFDPSIALEGLMPEL